MTTETQHQFAPPAPVVLKKNWKFEKVLFGVTVAHISLLYLP